MIRIRTNRGENDSNRYANRRNRKSTSTLRVTKLGWFSRIREERAHRSIDRRPPPSNIRVFSPSWAHTRSARSIEEIKLIRSIAAPLSVYELLGAMHWKPARQRFRAIFLSILAVFLWPRIVEFVYQQNSSYSTFPRAIPSSFFTIISIYCDSN